MSNEIVRKNAPRGCKCRGCGKKVPTTDDVIFKYYSGGRGQNVFLCIPCAQFVGELANGVEEKLNKLGL
jgi:hypothetical protein